MFPCALEICFTALLYLNNKKAFQRQAGAVLLQCEKVGVFFAGKIKAAAKISISSNEPKKIESYNFLVTSMSFEINRSR